ncbi:hypothetical protein C0995_002660 [Termitomyces sp. Mi166|nr:hypothetical protein C0995_002660 [Termitomyces sp. Mi166\
MQLTAECLLFKNCATLKRKRIQHIAIQPYHEYAKSLSSKFTNLDLAVAFNSGLSEDTLSWEETILFLVKNKIPTVFTAYNRDEAEAEAKILQAAGANLVHALGPVQNPWRSISFKKEPGKVTGFYSVNGWLAGGFH